MATVTNNLRGQDKGLAKAGTEAQQWWWTASPVQKQNQRIMDTNIRGTAEVGK